MQMRNYCISFYRLEKKFLRICLIMANRQTELGKLPQSGRQDSGHMNPGLDCTPTESSTDNENRRYCMYMCLSMTYCSFVKTNQNHGSVLALESRNVQQQSA